MPKRPTSSVPAIASLITALATISPNQVFAAPDCLPQPTRDAAPGEHWYYHLDRVANRKCWYLVQPRPMAPQPVPDAGAQPAFSSFFSSLMSGFPRANPSETQQGVPTSTGYVTPDELRGSDGSTDQRLRMGPQPDTTGSVSSRPQHRQPPSRSRPQESRPQEVDKQSARPLSQAERDVLFQEYLQWRERQP